MNKYVWTNIYEQEFQKEIKNVCIEMMKSKKNELAEMQKIEDELKKQVAEKAVQWKISVELDKNAKTRIERCYSELNQALAKHDEYMKCQENIAKRSHLQSEIELLERYIEK